MTKQLKYSTRIKSTPFLFLELKKMVKLKINNPDMTDKELKQQAIEENLFQVNTDSRNKTIAAATIRRMKVLDDYLLDKLLNGTIETGKQIAIYSILKTNRLFYEFMKEVYLEKYILKDPYLEDKDFNIFFQNKAEQSERVAGWSDYTYYKLKQVIIRVLFESGLIKDQKEREIVKPIINQELTYHLEDIGDKNYLEVLLGGV